MIGLALIVWLAKIGVRSNYPAFTIAGTIMDVLALVLVFTPQPSNWLRMAPSEHSVGFPPKLAVTAFDPLRTLESHVMFPEWRTRNYLPGPCNSGWMRSDRSNSSVEEE